jgi:hypothetical protein
MTPEYYTSLLEGGDVHEKTLWQRLEKEILLLKEGCRYVVFSVARQHPVLEWIMEVVGNNR